MAAQQRSSPPSLRALLEHAAQLEARTLLNPQRLAFARYLAEKGIVSEWPGSVDPRVYGNGMQPIDEQEGR